MLHAHAAKSSRSFSAGSITSPLDRQSSRTSSAMLSLIAVLAFTAPALSQGLNAIQGAPECVQSCTTLSDVANSCSGASSIVDAAFCFCTNPNISAFPANPALCSATCQDGASQAAASQWFAAFCANPATLTAPQSQTATAPPSDATSSPTAPDAPTTDTESSSTPTPSDDSGSDSDSSDGPPEDESWWDSHARWVAMAIVLVVGFAIIIIIGIFWKRHHNKKRNRGDRLAPGQHWGPAQHQRHPSTENYVTSTVHDTEKGTSTVRQGVPLRQADVNSEPNRGKGLKRLIGR